MGVDAQLLVRTKSKKVDSKFVKNAAYELASSFGPEKFFIYKEGEGSHHCLSLVDRYTQDGPDIVPEDGEKLIEVHLWTRYYGEGYERGDLPLIIMISKWLEYKIPDSEVWYGGDSSGICAEKFDEDARERLFRHFVDVNHRPYIAGWDALGSGLSRYCDFCEEHMSRYGWGGAGEKENAAFGCSGCGLKEKTRDGGKTWEEDKEK